LRNSNAFISELSIVEEYDGKIVGHILLTKITIDDDGKIYDSLALAPVSVKPEFQKKGIGGCLILESHKEAKRFGYKSIILLGHEKYYPRFGYQMTSNFGIKLPFNAPDECCMAIELIEGGLKGVSGTVVYPKEFFE
jgi:predicted N-acetyltransferase YhbS